MRKTYIQIDGKLYEKSKFHEPPKAGYDVVPDIQPYQSMVTGEIITSRSKHRQHLKDHNMVEVGNDSCLSKPHKIPDPNPNQRRELLRRYVNQFTNAEWDRATKRHREAVIRHMENSK